MQTIPCKVCGKEIAEDDFVLGYCPICDSYMEITTLSREARPELLKVIRVVERKEQ